MCFTVYYLTNTRLPFLLSLLALFCIFNISKISFYKTSKFFLIIALFLVLVAPLIVLFLSITFDQKVDLYVMINKLLSNRLQLVNNAYYEYGIGLFSKDIIYTMQPGLYNVIDSSFMIVLIEYGVITYIVFIAFWFIFYI